jgi:putative PIN family toxin of toxin-antitoxin system
MRVVFDTNVLVAAFLTEGVCSVLLTRARRKEFELFLCPVILDEFRKVLSRWVKKYTPQKNDQKRAEI